MEASKEPISVRISRLNNQLLGKNIEQQSNENKSYVDREGLLDALNVLYDECNTESLKKNDKFIANFVDKFKNSMSELRRLRVNISDFEVKNVIGRGHFGIVHVVQEKQTGDIYAMKTLRKADSLNHTSTCYEEERDIMAKTTSPWLTQLQYAFQDSGHLYLVMEFHPGGDLYGLLERQGGFLNENAAIFYISELVEAIKALHSMGYVHRDVKPDNVLLDRCGHLKLADFGSAAKINSKGIVSDKDVISIGTSDYIAPEVLQSIDKPKNKIATYGKPCDYWSLGVLAYEITIGNTPFAADSLSVTYNKIMNHAKNLKFPNDKGLSENYISLVKGLLCDQNVRLSYEKIIKHPLFKEIDWTTLREQVPPFVPIVNSVDDTSNFLEVESKRPAPCIDNFKSKTQFSGRNLPFIGFTFTNINSDVNNITVIRRSEEELLQNRKKQVESLQKMLAKAESSSKEYETLEAKYEECSRKLEGVENVRDKLEKDLSAAIADASGLRRTLELERRERKELENKALDLIKSAKQKWEISEKSRVEKLHEQIEVQNNRITELCTSNNELTSRLERSQKLHEETEKELERLKNLQKEHQDSLIKARALSRKSIVGVENRLERISVEAQAQIQELQNKLSAAIENSNHLQQEIELYRKRERVLEEQIALSADQIDTYKKQLETSNNKLKIYENDSIMFKNNLEEVESLRSELHASQTQIQKLLNDNKCARLEEQLKHEQSEVKSLRRQLKDLKTSMNETIMTQDSIVQEKEVQFEKDIKKMEAKLRDVTNEKEELRNKLQEALVKDNANKLKVQNLEELLARLESGVTKLESGSPDTVLEAQIKRLEEQIKVLHETAALEKQELRQANTNLWRKEKELSNCELDKRIVERELKGAEEKIKTLNTEINNLKNSIGESSKTHDEALKEIENSNSKMKLEIHELQTQIGDLESNVCSYKAKYESEQKVVEKLRNQLDNASENIDKLNKDLRNEMKTRKMLEKQIDEIREENIRLNYNKDMSRRDEDEARRELDSCRRELENTQLNINVLKDACKLLEGQLEEYEQLISTYETKEASLSSKMSELSDEVVSSKSEIQEARQKYNEEKTMRLLAETQCKRLQEDVDLLQKECSSYKQQVLDYKELSSQLNEDMTATEERCAELEYSLKQLERQFDGLKSECIAVKEESAKRLTHIHQVRESNYKLNQELQEVKDDNSVLMAKIAHLELSLNDQTNYYKQRELKSDATIQQQTKLIDFLQTKIDDQHKKKKTLSDVLFGHSKKENVPPTIPLNYKELESMLMKERESNRNLREEVTKLKAMSLPNEKYENQEKVERKTPPNSPRTKMALEQLVQSPASQIENFQRKPSVQRMHHNIPHRFESRICIKPAKCIVCSEPFQIGRSISVCKECSLTSHTKCIHKVPRTCGLPGAYAKHFTKTLSNSDNSQKTENQTQSFQVQSYVKIPSVGQKGWTKKFARLENTTLCIYEHEPSPNMAPVTKIELCPSESYKMSLLSEVTANDCQNVAGTDLPFIIKIDVGPNTTCWPQNSQYLMFLNATDKEKWVTALQSLSPKPSEKVEKIGTTISKLVNNEQVNCVQEVSKDILLLGCEEGLFSHIENKQLIHITGVTKIYQIGFVRIANLALMICEDKRILVKAELKQLESLAQRAQFTKPNLVVEKINTNNRENFLLFETSNFVKNQIICAATNKQLIIIKYDFETLEFRPIRILDTAEPCSCILFNEHSVIVGANKYFEIDLKTFGADEFLDASDHRLTQAYNCYKLGSYPISILAVSKKPELEFLLCFNEFGCFVDEFGRRSRQNDIKWSHLPLAFAFCPPFLFIVQFSAIEIIRINPDPSDNVSLDSWECPESQRFEFSKIKYLGSNKKGIYILVKNEVRFVSAKTVLGEIELEDLLESETSDDGQSEFSFTSSQLQSLDGLESSCEGEGEKRVHFAHQTDL